MFTPATRKSKHRQPADSLTVTPVGNNKVNRPKTGTPAPWASRLSVLASQPSDSSTETPVGNSCFDNSIASRPKTGTPAPWASRLSVLARIPQGKNSDNVYGKDPMAPVLVKDFPQVVHDELTNFVRKLEPGEACIDGGIDQETALSWMICGSKLFVWSCLSPTASRNCVVLDIPAGVSQNINTGSYCGNGWLLRVISWDDANCNNNVLRQLNSAGIVLCNQKTQAIVYWPDIYADNEAAPVISLASLEDQGINSSSGISRSPTSRLQSRHRRENISTESGSFNSLIASAIRSNRSSSLVCVALATSSCGELWKFNCSPTGILRQSILSSNFPSSGSDQSSGENGYPRSLIWRFPYFSTRGGDRQFFLLTDHEIQCFSIELSANLNVRKVWSQEIIGLDNDLGIKKDLAGQKRIWPLDVQVDERGKEITILVAIFCKDRLSSSSYMQYSLLTMQYRAGLDETSENLMHERVLEKKAPVEVIIPKARLEEEEFLFSMRLRVGGKPKGSAVILSGDGTATVSYYWRNSMRLYRFDLPYDAGKVLDASVFPCTDDSEEGAWIVLTEKAGVWAIPEKTVLDGGVEPPERSLSRNGSSIERSAEEEKKSSSLMWSSPPGKDNVDRSDITSNQRAGVSGFHEAEAIVSRLFHDFLVSGKVDVSFEKLENDGAFEREGETNAFVHVSKSIVDTLAKHWTTTRGAEIVALAVISNQLSEKQQKHEKYLQFLALSKCHEKLSMTQRHALQIVLEHGEKVTGMMQMRELQNMISQSRAVGVSSQHMTPEREVSGSLWDLIQIVGEKARRNTVLLMDRDNAEVFYSKISDLEEVFRCLQRHLNFIISKEHPLEVQVERICELSKVCVTLVRSAMHYKNEHHMWYPPPDGLAPWYCQPVVREGIWSVASFMIETLSDSSGIDFSSKSDICSHLEVLADVLLEAYVGAITAKIELGEEHKGLLDDYWTRRDVLLDSLYQQIKAFVDARCQDEMDGNEDKKEVIFREFFSSLLSVGRRHEAYLTLWNICCDLNDTVLLKELMHGSLGPRGGFSYFVFEQLYENKQYSKLIRLGEEFPQELLTFLKDHQSLLWLHEIFLHQFSAASKTLHLLALTEGDRLLRSAENPMEPGYAKSAPTLSERKRFLHLSKIAALAGKDIGHETELARIDADLKILKSQEDILKLLPDDIEKQPIGERVLHPLDLIKFCLQGQTPELLLKAFDVFAWTSSSFRRSNKSLLEECWRKTADQDNWEKLHQFSHIEEWSDEVTTKTLKKTMLYQVARRCYGPESESYDGGFDELLPLRDDSILELPSMKDSGSSVEAILKQHKDFSTAGKLMLMAVILGSALADVGDVDDPVPME